MAVSKTADQGSNPCGPAFVRRSLGEVGIRFAKFSRTSAGAARQKAEMNMYYVYILKCADGKPYTGCTENIEERLERHSNGHVPATENRRPLELAQYIAFQDKYKAFAFEKYLKSGSGRAFIKKHLS